MSHQVLHPLCEECNFRKGGDGSWDGRRCKCGHYSDPLKTYRVTMTTEEGELRFFGTGSDLQTAVNEINQKFEQFIVDGYDSDFTKEEVDSAVASLLLPVNVETGHKVEFQAHEYTVEVS